MLQDFIFFWQRKPDLRSIALLGDDGRFVFSDGIPFEEHSEEAFNPALSSARIAAVFLLVGGGKA
jgi:hypothetical protein